MLLDRACGRREYCVGVGTDQADRTNYNDEDHRQHNRILGDILGFVLKQYVPEKTNHLPPPVGEVRASQTTNERQEGWGTAKRIGMDRERSRLAFTPVHHELCTSKIWLSSKAQFSNPR